MSDNKPWSSISKTARNALGAIGAAFHASVADPARAIASDVTGNVQQRIQGARNFAADIVSEGGGAVVSVAGVAGEISLLSAGAVPFLIFGGTPSTIADELCVLLDQWSRTVRGDQAQFMGLFHEEAGWLSSAKMYAVVYDPQSQSADDKGFAQLQETELYTALYEMGGERADVYLLALSALQEGKISKGMGVDAPVISMPVIPYGKFER